MRQRNAGNDVGMAAVKAIAVASSTPFKTAFMAMMGIFAAQLVGLVAFIGTVAVVGGALVYFLGSN